MKKRIFMVVCVSMLLLCSCNAKEQNQMKSTTDQTVTLINDVQDADVWILPQTPENLKTTVWGRASASDVKKGESRLVPLCEPGDGGRYLLRMIDADGFFYSANGIALRADRTIRIKETDTHAFSAEVTDENGALQNTYEVFCARL